MSYIFITLCTVNSSHHPILDDEDEKNTSYGAIDLVYGIASLTLFGEFQKRETTNTYRFVLQELKKLGLTVSSGLDVGKC